MEGTDNNYPATLSQATQWLLYYLPFKEKLKVAIITERELPTLKSSLGKFVEEEFALGSNIPLIESCRTFANGNSMNADKASQIIIREFWKQIRTP